MIAYSVRWCVVRLVCCRLQQWHHRSRLRPVSESDSSQQGDSSSESSGVIISLEDALSDGE